jgi:hypothetical protein
VADADADLQQAIVEVEAQGLAELRSLGPREARRAFSGLIEWLHTGEEPVCLTSNWSQTALSPGVAGRSPFARTDHVLPFPAFTHGGMDMTTRVPAAAEARTLVFDAFRTLLSAARIRPSITQALA